MSDLEVKRVEYSRTLPLGDIEKWLTDSNLRHGHIFGDGRSTLKACREREAQLWTVHDGGELLCAFVTTIIYNHWGSFLTFLGFGGHSGFRGRRIADVIREAFVEVELFAEQSGAKVEMICHPAFIRFLPNYRKTGIIMVKK